MASDILGVLEKDEELRKKLSKLIVAEILLDPELRLAIIEKSLGAVATKPDLKEIETGLKAEIEDVRTELKAEIEDVRTELKAEIENVRSEMKAEIKESEERLKDYVDVKFESVEKRIGDLYRVTLSSLFAIVVTLATVVITRLL